ncbi:hypothetical protein D3C71_672430 [compost metagenome]
MIGIAALDGLRDHLGERRHAHRWRGQAGKRRLQGFLQQFRDRAEQFSQALPGGRRQVIHAYAAHAQHDQRRRLGTILLKRSLRQGKAGAGTQGAHGRTGVPAFATRFDRLHLQQGIAFGLGRIGIEILAWHIIAFQRGRVFPARRQPRRHAGADGFLGFVVVAEHCRHRRAQGACPAERLDGVGLFHGPRAMKSDAAALRAAGVFRHRAQGAAVGEQYQAMAAIVFCETPGQAFFAQQPRDERQVRLAVLAAIAARLRLGHERPRVAAPAPVGLRRVGLEHAVNDLDHALVLPDAAVAYLAQQP